MGLFWYVLLKYSESELDGFEIFDIEDNFLVTYKIKGNLPDW